MPPHTTSNRSLAFPSELLERLDAGYRDSPDYDPRGVGLYVYAVIHECRYVYSPSEFSVAAICHAAEKANQVAMALFRREYPDFFSEGFKWYECMSANASDYALDNSVEWDVRGDELSLTVHEAGDGDEFQIYVQEFIIR
ncbi:uncharacterized protein N7459_008223 [Penicillium hispanicum]|uniref:uncharacterized protein n=1 Tax=Penicillium hispanicum TaxID=1080232 RepID=UPI002542504D|nr:uncharacterized protein N7459_008223 [Penicillium hispanicum]KAJ5573796.1 hypothetical protein N7459_008223 [Penicillium hispanicum]